MSLQENRLKAAKVKSEEEKVQKMKHSQEREFRHHIKQISIKEKERKLNELNAYEEQVRELEQLETSIIEKL